MTTPSTPTLFAAIGWPLRIPPSGPFIAGSPGGAPLLVGPGSIGIVLRAQGMSGSPEKVSSSALQAVTGLDNIVCALPGGYHYDVRADLCIIGPAAPAPAEELKCSIEASENNGTSWSELPGRQTATEQVSPGITAIFEEIDVDRTTAPNNATITNLRVRVENPSGSGLVTLQPGQCVLRVEQYILAPVIVP